MPHGGRRQPDGRQPVAPGVGETARRHDLEAPRTPGLGGPDRGPTDLQQGDVQQLESAQRIAEGAAPPRPRTSSKPRRRTTSQMGAPDPIEFIADRAGGQTAQVPGNATVPLVDPTPWLPLVRTVANNPGAGGAVAAALVRLLTDKRRMPQNPTSTVLDRQELDDILMDQ